LFASDLADTAALYSEHSSEATYARLHELAGTVLAAGLPVVIDATYLKQPQRAAAQAVAQAQGVPFIILDCSAPQAMIESWLSQRQAQQHDQDPSDATLEVIAAQERSRDPLSGEERLAARSVATHEAHSVDSLLDAIRQRLPGL
jgi:predicted kinase